MQFGIDQFLKNNRKFDGLRLGLVTNDAATTTDLIPARLAILAAGFDLRVLFSPEHGLAANGPDGHPMPNSTDAWTGLPVVSLYAAEQKMAAALLQNLDAVVFDLPDIGSRFYTYIWTLSHVMEACVVAGVKLIVLDRPNPLGGDLSRCEGPMLTEENLSSFIGRWRMPVRHSLTIGELATYWKSTRCASLNLEIIRMSGWKRSLFFHEIKCPFVPTSPAIPTAETTMTYPILCFLEATNFSEGRGTAYPFRVCGHPGLDGLALSRDFNSMNFKGVRARPTVFTPVEGKLANQICGGIMLHISDFKTVEPVKTGLALIALLKKNYSQQFAWASYPTAANPDGRRHFDLLTGQSKIREAIENDVDFFLKNVSDFVEAEHWQDTVRPFLLYK